MNGNSLHILNIHCLIHFLERMYHPQFCSTVYTFVLLLSAPSKLLLSLWVSIIFSCFSHHHEEHLALTLYKYLLNEWNLC